MGPLTSMALESPPVRQSAESHRLTPEQVCETEWAFKFGTLSARNSQLCEAVDLLFENLGEVGIDCPKVVAKVRAAMADARKAALL